MNIIVGLLGGSASLLFGTMGALFGTLFSIAGVVFGLILGLLIIVATCFFRAMVFSKMGENPIYAFIPIYNKWVLYKNTFGSGLWSLLLFVPVISYIIRILHSLELAKVFGKSEIVGVIIFLFPAVGDAILALSDADYQGLREYNYLDEIVGLFRR